MLPTWPMAVHLAQAGADEPASRQLQAVKPDRTIRQPQVGEHEGPVTREPIGCGARPRDHRKGEMSGFTEVGVRRARSHAVGFSDIDSNRAPAYGIARMKYCCGVPGSIAFVNENPPDASN